MVVNYEVDSLLLVYAHALQFKFILEGCKHNACRTFKVWFQKAWKWSLFWPLPRGGVQLWGLGGLGAKQKPSWPKLAKCSSEFTVSPLHPCPPQDSQCSTPCPPQPPAPPVPPAPQQTKSSKKKKKKKKQALGSKPPGGAKNIVKNMVSESRVLKSMFFTMFFAPPGGLLPGACFFFFFFFWNSLFAGGLGGAQGGFYIEVLGGWVGGLCVCDCLSHFLCPPFFFFPLSLSLSFYLPPSTPLSLSLPPPSLFPLGPWGDVIVLSFVGGGFGQLLKLPHLLLLLLLLLLLD